MLRSLVRRGCDLNRSLLPRSLSFGSRSQVTGGCTPSSLPVNEVVHGRTRVVVDRSYEIGVLGFESPPLGQQSAKFNREYLTLCSLGGMNALPVGWSRSAPQHLSQVRGFIQLKTNLEVADNSGAKRVQCIKVMKGSNAAKIGDIIMASVKDAQPRGKVKKGEVVTCVVVRAATQKLRRDGSEIKFDKNAVVLVNKQGEPIGTRIFGPVPHELRRRKLVKILTLAEYVA